MVKKLPEVSISFRDLYRMYIESIRSKLLLTGIELKVFNHLSEPKSADAVAKAIGTHPRNTRLFLDGLAAIDLLEKRDGLYRNSPIAQIFLVENSPIYLGLLFTVMVQSDSPVLENLSKLVREGPPRPSETSPFSEELVAQFAAIYASSELAEAQELVKIVSELPEFPSFRKMLDLGGGPGLFGIAILATHPNMKGVNFDLPPMAKISETYIKEYGMEDRMEVLGGDFNTDSIGEGYDLVLASGSLQFAKDIDSVVKKSL